MERCLARAGGPFTSVPNFREAAKRKKGGTEIRRVGTLHADCRAKYTCRLVDVNN
jgi:hypothetical protein